MGSSFSALTFNALYPDAGVVQMSLRKKRELAGEFVKKLLGI